MTPEQKAELVCAFDDGFTIHHVSPVLTRLREAWLEADEKERETFRAEIVQAPSAETA
jgi:hypothetical protein